MPCFCSFVSEYNSVDGGSKEYRDIVCQRIFVDNRTIPFDFHLGVQRYKTKGLWNITSFMIETTYKESSEV